MSAGGSLPLALTIGEPAGVGLDLTLAIWRRRAELAMPTFYLIGDLDYVSRRAQTLGLDIPLAAATPEQAGAVFADALPLLALGLPITATPGKPDANSAPAAIAAIRRAVADVCGGRARAIVTNPVAKNVLYRSGFAEPGHTEFLARLAQETTGRPAHPVMMLWSPELAVVPVTIHLPLREAVSALTSDLIVTCGRVAARDLCRAVWHRAAAHRGRRAQSACRRRRHARRRRPHHRRSGCRHAARRRHRCRWPAPGRHHVPCAGARGLRRRAVHVSRPGADPDQDAGLRSRGERDARSALRAHVTRSRHRLRHRRQRHRRSLEPDCRDPTGRPPRRGNTGARRRQNDAKSTTCRRCARSSAGTG